MGSPQQNTLLLVATLVGLLLPAAIGTPFEYYPYTTSTLATSLSHDNPAFGAVSKGATTIVYVERTYSASSSSSTVTTNSSTTSNGVTTSTTSTTSKASSKKSTTFKSKTVTNGSALASVHSRMLEQSSTDLQKIESFYGTSLEMNVKNLASNAAYYVMPWPSSYWPTYQDGINYRWSSSGDASATEKYANAFGLDPTSLMKSVSQSTGILSMSSSKSPCSSNWDCSSQNDGSACAIREGESKGYCIPTWYGICHAWTPAALLEPEPNCDVNYNGVTFHPLDIKALISEVYDESNIGTVFTGARFNGPDSDSATDQYGRYTDDARRDLGPGFMHVALTNILSRFNSSVVMDVNSDSQVWNQPIYSYEVKTQTEMTPSAAANQYYGQSSYPFNSAAERIMYTEMTVTWMTEAYEDGGLVSSGRAASYTSSDTYTYLLELDNDYNILGGEWVGNSNSDHPDFLWFPKARPDLSTVTEVGISYKNVRTLLNMATSCS